MSKLRVVGVKMTVSTDSGHSDGDIIPKIQNAYLRYFPRKFDFLLRSSLVQK